MDAIRNGSVTLENPTTMFAATVDCVLNFVFTIVLRQDKHQKYIKVRMEL